MSARGAGSVLGIGEETTEGTAVTPTDFIPVRSMTPLHAVNQEVVEPLGYATDEAPVARDTFTTGIEVGVNFQTNLYYDNGIMILLKHLFGEVATSGSGPYVYSYEINATKPTKPSLTLEPKLGTGGPAQHGQQYAGVRPTKLTIDASIGQPILTDWETIGMTAASMSAPTSPTYANSNLATYNHATTLTFNSANLTDVVGCKLTIDRKLERTPELGTLTSGPVDIGGLVEVMLEVRQRYSSNAAHAALVAGTTAAGAWTITDGTRSFAFTFGRLKVMSVDRAVSGPGQLEFTTMFRCLGTPTNAGVELALTNGVAP